MTLTFDAATHTYALGGRRLPHVTGILKDLVDFSRVAPDILEYAREQGVHIHKMVELDAKGDLDVDTLPDWLKPRFDALQKFKRETRFVVTHSEERIHHPGFGYAGTFDLEGTIHDEKLAMIDVKRSLMAGDVIGLQTAAYAGARDYAISSPADRIKYRAALLLLPNGTYKLQPYEDPTDFHVFTSCLVRHAWKEQRK